MQHARSLKPIFLALSVAVAFALAGLLSGTAYAGGFTPCGDDRQCNSVPDGCGIGINCIQKSCTDVLCPNGSDDWWEKCNYCDGEN
jgi:hypothetical protein